MSGTHYLVSLFLKPVVSSVLLCVVFSTFAWVDVCSMFLSGSRRDELDDFPASADDYELVEEIGAGATARVCHKHLMLE